MENIIGSEGNKPDLSQKEGAFTSYKLPIPVAYGPAPASGRMSTKEGEVTFNEGDAIMTGADGKSWPIAAATFKATYIDNGDGTATKNRLEVTLWPLIEETQVQASYGLLTGQAGDYAVQHGNDYWILSAADYAATYAQPVEA